MLKVAGPEQKDIYSGKTDDFVYLPEGAAPASPISPAAVAPVAKDKAARIKAGEGVFANNCAACHQPNGEGVPDAFPPLANSDYLKAGKIAPSRPSAAACNGKLVVNGKTFDGVMPAWDLPDEDIANVLTYAYNSWGNSGEDVHTRPKSRLHGSRRTDMRRAGCLRFCGRGFARRDSGAMGASDASALVASACRGIFCLFSSSAPARARPAPEDPSCPDPRLPAGQDARHQCAISAILREKSAMAALAGQSRVCRSSYLGKWRGDLAPPQGEAQAPVTNVSWFAAQAFCEARGLRLPTTDEWEYALADAGAASRR